MTDKKIYEDDREESASGDALNQSGTQNIGSDDEDLATQDKDVVGEDEETDNEGRLTQRNNRDL